MRDLAEDHARGTLPPCARSHCVCNQSLISVTVTEIFNTQPCQALRPAAGHGADGVRRRRRSAHGAAVRAVRGGGQAAAPTRSASPRSTSSAVTSPPTPRAAASTPSSAATEEIEQTVEILARRRKNNAVLIGEAGVGKTAIAEGLALRIHRDEVPETLAGHADRRARPVRHDRRRPVPRPVREALQGGARGGRRVRGQDRPVPRRAAHRARRGRARGRDGRRQHPQAAAGARRAARDRRHHARRVPQDRARLRARPALLAGDRRGAVRRGHRRDPARPARRLRGRTTASSSTTRRWTPRRGCSDRYITEYHLPDKAIDLVDQAAAKLRLDAAASTCARSSRRRSPTRTTSAPPGSRSRSTTTGPLQVGETQIAAVVAARTGIPVGELVAGELQRLNELEADLHERVVGQDAAVEVVADTIRRARVGLSEGDRPLGSLPVPRPDRRRQDRAGQGARGAAVRDREGARPDRHVRVPRAAHGRAADRLAARLRRLRRRRPADRARAPAPVLA